jgi:uncharacterized protein
MTRTICIYHDNCLDGIVAAWCVDQALLGEVEYIPASYGNAPPDVTGADVIIVDFSYKLPVLMEMSKTARSVLVLDHHKTAAEDLAGVLRVKECIGGWREYLRTIESESLGLKRSTPRAIFDMERSGAQLAWDFFFQGPRAKLVDYVADRDLWQWKLPYSREVSAVFFSQPFNFQMMNAHHNRLNFAGASDFATEGAAILRKHDLDVAKGISLTQRTMVIGGYTVPVANLPYSMASDAAGSMAKAAPFAACYFDGPQWRHFSLRSRGDDGVDVSEIAKMYGGGGHRSAAGFKIPIPGIEGDQASPQTRPVTVQDSFSDLIKLARAEAVNAMAYFPQPNYVLLKVAEEAGEVVKAAVHFGEGRDTREHVQAEMLQAIAMLYRLWVEGDEVNGVPPIAGERT